MDSALIIKKKSNDGYYILFTMKIRKTIDHSQLVGKLRGVVYVWLLRCHLVLFSHVRT